MAGNILTDLALRLYAETSELKKGLVEAGNSVKNFKNSSAQAGKSVQSNFAQMSKGAGGALKEMTGGLNNIAPAANGAVGGFSSMAKGAMALNVALGPVGLIIAALAIVVKALSAYFTGTVDGANKFAEIMGFLQGLLGVINDLFIRLGKTMISAFEDPKKAIADLWDFIKQNLVNRFQGLVEYFVKSFEVIKNGFAGLGYAIKGLFDDDAKKKSHEYFTQMSKDLVDVGKASFAMLTGLDADSVLKKGIELMGEMKRKAQETAAVMLDIKKLELDREYSLIRQQKLETKFQEASLAASDTSKDYKDRLEAALEAKEAIIAISDEDVKLAKRAYDNQVKLNSLSETSQADKIKELGLLRELEASETKRVQRLREAQEKINTSLAGYQKLVESAIEYNIQGYKEMSDVQILAAVTAAKEEQKIQEEAVKAQLKIKEDAEKSWQTYQEGKLKESATGQLELLKKQLDEGLILQKEYAAKVADINKESALKVQEAYDAAIAKSSTGIDELVEGWSKYFENIRTNAAETGTSLGDLIGNAADQLMGISEQVTSAISGMFEAAKNKELKAAGDNAEKRAEIEKKYARKEKKIAIIQAVINGALGITKAFAQLGPIGGIIGAALIGLTTAAQIGVINSQTFAKGGIVKGPTLGLMGEYPGAKSNPEIVSPLSDLKEIIGGVSYKQVTEPLSDLKNMISSMNATSLSNQNLRPTIMLGGEFPGSRTNPDVLTAISDLKNTLGTGSDRVVFEIQYDKLVGVLNNGNQIRAAY
jgi:hypothetical protein